PASSCRIHSGWSRCTSARSSPGFAQPRQAVKPYSSTRVCHVRTAGLAAANSFGMSCQSGLPITFWYVRARQAARPAPGGLASVMVSETAGAEVAAHDAGGGFVEAEDPP